MLASLIFKSCESKSPLQNLPLSLIVRYTIMPVSDGSLSDHWGMEISATSLNDEGIQRPSKRRCRVGTFKERAKSALVLPKGPETLNALWNYSMGTLTSLCADPARQVLKV